MTYVMRQKLGIAVVFGVPLLFIVIIITALKLPFFSSYSGQFYNMVAIDLTLTIPLLYFILIRKHDISKLTVIPFFIAGIVISGIVIPDDHQTYLSLIKRWVFPFVELFVVGFILYKIRQTTKLYKVERGNTPDFYTALKQAAREALPKGVGEAFSAEIAIFYYGFFSWKKRSLLANEFSYHKKNSIISIWIFLIFLILVETAVIHLLVQHWNVTVAWTLSIISFYTALQILGILRSMSKRPIVVEEEEIHLRYGVFSETTIQRKNILSVELTSKSPEKNPEIKSMSPLHELEGNNVILHLTEFNVLRYLYGIRKKYKTLVLFVDEPELFKAKLAVSIPTFTI